MYKKALSHFKKVDPVLYKLAKNQKKIILEPAPDYYIRLVRSIVGQQLSVKAATSIFQRFEDLFSTEINPKDVLTFEDELIRKTGISYSKIKYIKDLSQKVRSKELKIEMLEHEDNEKIISELIKVKGIGVWSAEMFLMFGLGRPDIFSTGDLGLKNAIKKHYKVESPTNEKLLKISSIWSPYRTYACKILWTSLNNSPK